MRMPHALGLGGAAGWLSRTSPGGWKDIALRTRAKLGVDNIPMIAAGVTFYTILALFPGLAALISIYGLFADAGQVPQHVQALSHVLPGGAVRVLGDQMQALASSAPGGLSLTFAISLIISIWSANGAVKAMMTGLNMAFDKREERGYLKQTVISLAFTFGLLLFGMLTLVVLGLPAAVDALAGPEAAVASTMLCWAVLLFGLAVGLALLYRYGPSRGPVKLRWISWGNSLAVIVWLMVSALFTLYVSNFGHYNKTYGSLGAAVGFMTWIYLSSIVFLAGGELNAQIDQARSGAAPPS
jgi:membrane protein